MSTRCARLARGLLGTSLLAAPVAWDLIIQGAAGGNESGAGTSVGAALHAGMLLPVTVLGGVKQTDDRLVGQVIVSQDTCE